MMFSSMLEQVPLSVPPLAVVQHGEQVNQHLRANLAAREVDVGRVIRHVAQRGDLLLRLLLEWLQLSVIGGVLQQPLWPAPRNRGKEVACLIRQLSRVRSVCSTAYASYTCTSTGYGLAFDPAESYRWC